ncbi:hypothetical protein DI53_2505 [Sphingobacterium deserti]|uniref:Uncharacterized protein n=1 Tax=Sphingobacterium deserti TaxID=1229276 RepID=A0A0B8T036_9SPHI|nr:hypothetical protein DI53_2505 [Sphingobacterium deserti]
MQERNFKRSNHPHFRRPISLDLPENGSKIVPTRRQKKLDESRAFCVIGGWLMRTVVRCAGALKMGLGADKQKAYE